MLRASENNKRIARNTVFMYIRMFLIMLVTLYTSRIVLSILGIEDYGIYNIVGGIVVLFSFFNSALTSATQRFLSFELGRNDLVRFRKVVNLSFLVYVILSIIIVLLGVTIGSWFLNNKLDIPSGKIIEANWVFHFSLLAFVFGLLRTPYNASIIAHEKMSFYALISILEVILRLLIVYLLLVFPFSKLVVYSILMSFVAFIISLCYAIYCFKKFKECRPQIVKDKNILQHLLGFSGWSLLGSFATVSANQGVNIVMNLFFGVTVNAAMGISQQVSQAVNQFVSNFQVAFNPQITKSFAVGDKQYLFSLMVHAGKLSFFMMMILTIPLLIGMDLVLDFWLTIVPKYAEIFCQLTILAYLIDTLSAPLYMLVQASGRIRTYQICVSLLFLLNIVVSYIVFAIGFSPVSAMIIKIVVSILLLLYRIVYLQYKMGLPMWGYVLEAVIKPIILFVILYMFAFICYGLSSHEILIKVLFLISITCITACIVFFIGLSVNERNFILNLIKKVKK